MHSQPGGAWASGRWRVSLDLFNAVFRQWITPQGKKLTLLAFADAANPDGLCWMALQSERGKLDIRTKASCSLRSLQGHISTLVDEGYLERWDTPGKGTVWRVHATPVHKSVDGGPATPADIAGVQGMTPAGFAGPPAGFAGEPLSKHHEKEKAERLSPTVDKCPLTGRPLPTGVSLAQWEAFMDMRVGLSKPLRAYQANVLLAKLDAAAKAGWHPGDVVDRSTVNAWPDVYEPDGGRVTGVRRVVAGQVAEPVGMSEQDRVELARIAAIDDTGRMLAERREFMTRMDRRNAPVSFGTLLSELPLRPPVKGS